jgi:multicomponent Na+:H+ antiporter subunit E
MLVAIVKANIDVAVIVLQRRMPISPGIVKFKTDIRKDFRQGILANSITLTPGTLTIDMEDDVYVVHCLTRANAEDVCQWNMEQELLQIEEKAVNPEGEACMLIKPSSFPVFF